MVWTLPLSQRIEGRAVDTGSVPGRVRQYCTFNQVREGFRPVNQRKPGSKIEHRAEVIPLNAGADSSRNMTPQFDGSYATPPPVRVPYGWRLAEKPTGAGWLLTHDRREWAVISWLIQERRAGGNGRSYVSLAAELRRDGEPAPTGGRSVGRWHGERVRKLIASYAPDLAGTPRAQRGSRLAQLYDLDEDAMTEEEKEELEALEQAADALYDADHAGQ